MEDPLIVITKVELAELRRYKKTWWILLVLFLSTLGVLASTFVGIYREEGRMCRIEKTETSLREIQENQSKVTEALDLAWHNQQSQVQAVIDIGNYLKSRQEFIDKNRAMKVVDLTR